MTAPEKPKIIMTAKENIGRLSRSRPAYLAPPPAIDERGAAFPWDQPSSMHLQAVQAVEAQLVTFERGIEVIQLQIRFMREGLAAAREALALPAAPAPAAPVAAVAPPVAPEPTLADTGMAMAEAATVIDEVRAEVASRDAIEASLEAMAAQLYDIPETLRVQPGVWLCQVHGKAQDGISRKGRPYRYCPVCGEVDRSTVGTAA